MLFLDMPIVPPFMQGAFLSAGKDAQTTSTNVADARPFAVRRRVVRRERRRSRRRNRLGVLARGLQGAHGGALRRGPDPSVRGVRRRETAGRVLRAGRAVPVRLPARRARGSTCSSRAGWTSSPSCWRRKGPTVRRWRARGTTTASTCRGTPCSSVRGGRRRDVRHRPGQGRFDETPFVGAGAFGSLFRRADGSWRAWAR